jgi:hypothetical protein
MFKQKKHHQYVNSYFKPITSMKLNKIISKANDDNHHHYKTIADNEGLYKAYNAPDAIYVEGNRMYVAGTRSIGEAVRDWWKIPTGKTVDIERYGQLTEALRKNPQVDTLISHSLGANAVAELQKQTNNKYMARYYGAPFFNVMPWDAPDPRNQTFRHPGDPISAFDHKAVDIRPGSFDFWLWPHGYGGYDPSQIPETYSNNINDDKDNPDNPNNNNN